MTCREIYETALRLLGESTNAGENDDYEERAPYLIASFCTEVKETDAMWRERADAEAQGEWNAVWIDLDSDFPLSERFAPAAAYFVAAMLVVDSNEGLSDRLYDRCTDAVNTVSESISARVLPIVNRY